MKILVTGGAGFIGSNFIRYMIKKYPHYAIVNFDKLTYAGNLENLKDIEDHPNYDFVKGDILNFELLDHLLKNTDVVINFAAESHVDRSILDAGDFVKTNILGTQTLLEACRKNKIKRFHHISTDEVYGSLGYEGYFNEDTPYSPRSPYSASKAASDHLVRAFWHTHKFPVTISNCSNNYGPYQFPEKVIPLFITNLIDKKKVPLYGDGLNVRDWIHVDDHNEAVDLILHEGKDGETYCISSMCEKTNLELTNTILEKMGVGEEMINYVKDRKGHDRRYAVKPHKLMAELGWQPKVTFYEGLEKTIQWYKDNEQWWRRVKSKEYLTYYEKQYGAGADNDLVADKPEIFKEKKVEMENQEKSNTAEENYNLKKQEEKNIKTDNNSFNQTGSREKDLEKNENITQDFFQPRDFDEGKDLENKDSFTI